MHGRRHLDGCTDQFIDVRADMYERSPSNFLKSSEKNVGHVYIVDMSVDLSVDMSKHMHIFEVQQQP